jgi:biopolymer transport protein ExbD
MKEKYFDRKRARIEIIPMIDIMFFLLVFFIIVTLQLIPTSGMNTKLPESTTAKQLKHPKIVISLQRNGTMYVQGRIVTSSQLTAMLEEYPNPTQVIVTIAGAKEATLQELVNTMDACRRAGVSQIGIAARRT